MPSATYARRFKVPKYLVSVEEVVRHTVPVEADSEEEAGEIAIEAVVNSPDEEFFMSIEDRYVYCTLEQGD